MPFRFPNRFTGEAAVAQAEQTPLTDAIPLRTTLACLEDVAAASPGKTALRHLAAPDAAPLDVSFAALAAQVRRMVNALHRLGLGAGDAVVLLLPNHPTTVAAQLAAQAAGVACPINHYLREDADRKSVV